METFFSVATALENQNQLEASIVSVKGEKNVGSSTVVGVPASGAIVDTMSQIPWAA
jgi:hypothetical protein